MEGYICINQGQTFEIIHSGGPKSEHPSTIGLGIAWSKPLGIEKMSWKRYNFRKHHYQEEDDQKPDHNKTVSGPYWHKVFLSISVLEILFKKPYSAHYYFGEAWLTNF